jgi:hypothetical protein
MTRKQQDSHWLYLKRLSSEMDWAESGSNRYVSLLSRGAEILALFAHPLSSERGVCAILLRLFTSTKRLKRVYRSLESLLEIDYFTQVMVLIIIFNFLVHSFYLKLT